MSLQVIQNELKAPKSKYNSFGKYNYRSCEDILEAVKPLLAKHDCNLFISDTSKELCGVPVIIATVTFIDSDGKQTVVTAEAAVDLTKKGMDNAQTFGTSSSYARKYALNGLFLIDDTKDADTDEYAHQTRVNQKNIAPNPSQKQPINQKAFDEACSAVSSGQFTVQQVERKYFLTDQQRNHLQSLVKTVTT
ncbi:ERF family protein [Acinetobacter nectaris]|uniref:ERF family protein n=1 Tax=Acinetobacter nectaris TaxID=1219382 RepID=UPI001F1F33D9|nr:ERF family protein [Acinetobacter nectaris]MCF9035303.1 ERF family protein [Acinetobacter nectaris]